MNEAQNQQCIFCTDNGNLSQMMEEALIGKHGNSQAESSIGYINVILGLEQPCSGWQAWATNQYKEYLVADQAEQFMKRQYKSEQFHGKITMLTEYYKFHSDVPRIVQSKIEKILGKYYDKKRQFDYKKIKKILRQQQGLSITSIQNETTEMSDDQVQKRSRYSTLLDVLDQTNQDHPMSDSKLLKQMCRTIEKALPKNINDRKFSIKGSFNPNTNDFNFEQFLKKNDQKRTKQFVSSHNYTKPLNLKQLLARRDRNRYSKLSKQNSSSKQKISKQEKFKDSRDYKDRQFKDPRPNLTRERDNRQSRQALKEKDRCVYNTNIKIQIKNAMFYSQQSNQQAKTIDFESTKKHDLFKKKNFINQLNLINQPIIPNKKLIAQVYKSTQHQQPKKRIVSNTVSRNRISTKQSINRSQSRQKIQLIKNNGSASARRLNNIQPEWGLSVAKGPTRSSSTTSIKKRSSSLSTVPISANVTSAAALKSLKNQAREVRGVGTLSKYGSSEVGDKKSPLVKDILSRKLIFKKQ